MLYILLGVVGFLVAFLVDPISLRQIPYAKPAVWVVVTPGQLSVPRGVV